MMSVAKEWEESAKWIRLDATFGVVIFLNALTLGANTDCRCEEWDGWMALEVFFLILYIFELIIRARLYGLSEFARTVVTDPWMQFDIVVIITSFYELVSGSEGGALVLARQIRFVKLIKTIRMLKVFKDVAMLVEALVSAIPTMFWAIMLLVVAIMMNSVLLTTLGSWGSGSDNIAEIEFLSNFSSILNTAWTLIKMLTFDGWADYLRDAFFVISSGQCMMMALAMTVFMIITGLGLLNLLVGRICQRAFELESQKALRSGVERLMLKRHALILFKKLTRQEASTILQDPKSMPVDDFRKMVIEDPEMKNLLAALGRSTNDFLSLAGSFVDGDGMVDVDGIIEAIGIIEMMHFADIRNGATTKPETSGTVLTPVNYVFFQTSLRELDRSVGELETNGRKLCALAIDSLTTLSDRNERADTMYVREDRRKMDEPQNDVGGPTHDEVTVDKLEEVANKFSLQAELQRIMMPFDLIFGSAIMVNGIFTGAQTASDEFNLVLYLIDLGFTLAFSAEFVLRTRMAANLAYIYQKEEGDSEFNFFEQAARQIERFRDLKAGMKCLVWPPRTPGGCRDFWYAFCVSLRDMSVLMDFVIVALSLGDSLIIVQLRRTGAVEFDAGAVKVIRIFRLFRLGKLARLFKLFPQLQRLLAALMATTSTVIWAIVLLLGVLYGYSVYAVTLLGDKMEEDVELKFLFGTLRDAFLTGWQITTFDQFDNVLPVIMGLPDMMLAFFGVSVGLGLGLMNIVVGVLSEAAINLGNSQEIEEKQKALVEFLESMKRMRVLCTDDIGEPILASSFIEKALGLQTRPPRQGAGQGESDRLLDSYAMDWGESPQFTRKVRSILDQASISPATWKRIVDKVDQMGRGFVDVNDLTQGALVLKEDLAKVELYGFNCAMTDLLRLSDELKRKLVDVHFLTEKMLCQMSTVLLRRPYDAHYWQEAEKHEHEALNPQLLTMKKEAEDALWDLGRWPGIGTLPEILSMGSLSVTAGTGKINVIGDKEITGNETFFRTEMKDDDHILYAVEHQGNTIWYCVFVDTIMGQDRLKYIGSDPVSSVWNVAFFIVKATPIEDNQSQTIADIGNAPLARVVATIPKIQEPRSCQQVFEWDLATKHKILQDTKIEEMKFQALREKEGMLYNELLMLMSRTLMQKCFNALKENRRPLRNIVTMVWPGWGVMDDILNNTKAQEPIPQAPAAVLPELAGEDAVDLGLDRERKNEAESPPADASASTRAV